MGMAELYVIRHGIADDPAEHGGRDDRRQLTKKGREKVIGVAESLRARGVQFDAIYSSPLARALETAEIIRRECSALPQVTVTGLLKPTASFDDLIEYLNQEDKASSAVVGHEPFLSGFVSYALARSRMPFVRLKKAGVALLDYEGELRPGNCELAWLAGPAQLIE